MNLCDKSWWGVSPTKMKPKGYEWQTDIERWMPYLTVLASLGQHVGVSHLHVGNHGAVGGQGLLHLADGSAHCGISSLRILGTSQVLQGLGLSEQVSHLSGGGGGGGAQITLLLAAQPTSGGSLLSGLGPGGEGAGLL